MILSDFQLGALAWVAHNFYSATRYGVFKLDLNIPQDQLAFCHRVNQTATQITQYGATIRQGCIPSEYSEQRQANIIGTITHLVYTRLEDCWNSLSNIVHTDPADEERRYTIGPSQHRNSCAVDVAITLGIWLNLWRCCADTLPFHRQDQVPLPGHVLRLLIYSNWGLLSSTQRDGLRDLVKQALATASPEKFPTDSELSVQSVIDTLYQGVPQLSWNVMKSTRCCDGKFSIPHNGNVRQCNSLSIPRLTKLAPLSKIINDQFGFALQASQPTPCTREEECNMSRRQLNYLLVDERPPPRLIAHFLQPILHSEAETIRPFATLVVQMTAVHGLMTVAYRPVAAVYIVNNNHFVCRASKDLHGQGEKLYHFDGGNFSVVEHWWSDYQGITPIDGLPTKHHRNRERFPRLMTVVFQMIHF